MTDARPIQIDIVSDVMCPWCIIGYRQLERALGQTGLGALVRWHPFELNPDMPPEGEPIGVHIARKYGSSPEQMAQNHAQIKALGQSLGITFNTDADSRIVNSFLAHQLLDFALALGKQHPLKLALFEPHFTDLRDVSDMAVLSDIAASVGIDRADADKVLTSGALAATVRDKQSFWTSRGISGVLSMVFGGKYLVTGAQGAGSYAGLLTRAASEAA
ncbi:MAG: DsbA family oxidoreductase [Pseudomonadota bacterium]